MKTHFGTLLGRPALFLARQDGHIQEMSNPMKAPKPFVTWGLCISLILIWVVELFNPDVMFRFAFMPVAGLFEPWRFLTAAFLHSVPSPFHLAFNTWALWVVGRALEPVIGHVKLGFAFIICAFGAMLAQCLTVFVDPTAWITPTVGASGAVFGFFGMVLAIQRVLRLPWTEMAALVGINFVIGFVVPNVAWVAHLGGLVVGLILGLYTGWVLRHARYEAIVPPSASSPDVNSPVAGLPGSSPSGTPAGRENDVHEDKDPEPGLDSGGSEPNAQPVRLHRVTSTATRLRDFGVYFGLTLVLIAGDWAFYHFNYATIYAIFQQLSS